MSKYILADESVIKQVLDALEQYTAKELTVGQRYTNEGQRLLDTITDLRATLAQQTLPAQEPAFHGFMSDDGTRVDLCFTPNAPRIDGTYATAYYTTSPQRRPLSDEEPAGRVVSANCEYATVQWLKQTSNVGGGDPKNSRSWPIAGDAVYTAPPQPSAPVYYEVSSVVTHNLWMRVSKSQYDEYIRSGWDGRTLHALALAQQTLSAESVAMYETDVQVVEKLPEFDLLYVQNSQGTRFAVDQDTELQTELLPGVTYRAQVNAEGYALKISRLHNITDSNKDN